MIIKVISCIAIAGALGLTLGKLSGMIVDRSLLDTLFWLGSVTLLLHLAEAIAVRVLADRAHLNPFKASIYTFWMGVAGISELLLQIENSDSTSSQP